MKEIIIGLIGFCFCAQLSAQETVLLRPMLKGGVDGNGTIAHLNSATAIVGDVYDFTTLNYGGRPEATRLLEWEGMLWGLTQEGGRFDQGVLFKYNSSTNEYTTMVDLLDTIGTSPKGSLFLASNGKMYGLTCYGGYYGNGVLFEYSPSTNVYEVKVHFDETNGSGPFGSLVQASNGLLYGTTFSGGTYESGVLFSYNIENQELIRLFSFGSLGCNPVGTLCYSTNGKLYGIACDYCTSGSGLLYEFDIASSSFASIHEFSDEESLYGGLIEISDQALYGMTRYGGIYNYGYIFSYKLSTGVFSAHHHFNKDDGGIPYGDLYQANNGLLYGLTSFGGSNLGGVLFEFDPVQSTYIKKHDFSMETGYYPKGTLMQASNGTLYGLTSSGGYPKQGGLFEYDILTDSLRFNFYFETPELMDTYSGLIHVSGHEFIGMSHMGGVFNKGGIYLYDYSANSISTVVPFDGLNGAQPYGGLFKGQNGKFYGMASQGGSLNYGVIFEYNTVDEKISKLIDLEGWNGKKPMGNFVQLTNGNLYGMSYAGGKNGVGVLLEFNPNTLACDTALSFTMAKGVFPKGSLCLGNDGLLYGLTSSGGQGSVGTFFSYNTDNKFFNVIKYLDYTTGYSPYSTPYLASNGKVYCTTPIGGLHGKGTIFTYKPENGEFEVIHSFDGANGSSCKSDLMQASDGMLYGTTAYGGANNNGVFFSVNPDSNQFTKLADVNQSGGYNPMYGALVEIPGNVGVPDTPLLAENLLTVFPNPIVDEYLTLLTQKQANLVCITNQLGQIVYKQHAKGSTHKISTQSLVNGVYIVQVQNDDGKVDTQKFVVLKN